MYYLKIFILYSYLGFTMESTLFKITNANKYSGVFYGPVTLIYGFGIINIEIINKYIFRKIKYNKVIKYLLEFITLVVILSITEYLGGVIINKTFHIDMWNYSDNFMAIGKYICLRNSLIWGLLGTLYINIFKKFTDKIINIITKNEFYFLLLLFIIDILFVIFTKI